MPVEMREVQVWIDTGKVLRILTNDLTSSAQTIADLDKRRWAIEFTSAGSMVSKQGNKDLFGRTRRWGGR